MSVHTKFILNDREVSSAAPAGMLVLDFLRKNEGLIGTKEGCKEGDCGACAVLVGELAGDQVEYMPVTSCLMPVAELHGKHLVTVEGINAPDLTPVQEAICEEGGSQCGFCTPGFVMSLTGFLLQTERPLDRDGLKYAIGGNLCRCTGYSSLKRAGERVARSVSNGISTNGKHATRIEAMIACGVIPAYFKTISERLKAIPQPIIETGDLKPDYLIAGGTDIYVQRGELLPDAHVGALNLRPDLRGIRLKKDRLHIGALTTFEAFAAHEQVRRIIPAIEDFMLLNASWQIRNRATIGGNIVNASPIGDMTALLLALECELVLQHGSMSRSVAMKSFFKGYKQLDKRDDEILTEIIMPVPDSNSLIHFEKVSKRRNLDIASLTSGIKVVRDKDRIVDVQLSMGGVAPIPLFMEKTCAFLRGKSISAETVISGAAVADSEIAPISDIRGAADYKRLLVRQFLIAHFTVLFPDHVTVRSCYEAY